MRAVIGKRSPEDAVQEDRGIPGKRSLTVAPQFRRAFSSGLVARRAMADSFTVAP